MESYLELSTETRKHRTDTEILKGTKDKVEREAREASMRADAIKRRAEEAEAVLRGAIEENFRLQKKIKDLEAQLEAAEKKVAEATSKAVADFQMSVEYEDEKIKFSTDAYAGEK